MSIVVTGATGHLGRLVVESLLRAGCLADQVVATGRNPSASPSSPTLGVRTAVADYDDPAALDAAFAGAETGCSWSPAATRASGSRSTAAVIDAAKAAGVALLVYTSIPHADTTPMALAADHRATEELLRASGVAFTFLRNNWYIENYLPQIRTYLEHGVVGAAGDGRISAATRADFADAAAAALLDPTSAGRVYELGGESWTLAELAATVADASGRPVTYTEVSPAQRPRSSSAPVSRSRTRRPSSAPTSASPGASSR